MTDSSGYFRLRGLVRSQYAARLEGPAGVVEYSAVEIGQPVILRMEPEGEVASEEASSGAESDEDSAPPASAEDTEVEGIPGAPSLDEAPASSDPPGEGQPEAAEHGASLSIPLQ